MKYIIAIVLACILFFLFVPFYVIIKFKRKGQKNYFDLKIVALKGIIEYKINFLHKTQRFKKNTLKERYKKIKKNKLFYKTIFVSLWRKVKIKKFYWITIFGLDDAALTAILDGVLWSIKNYILIYIIRQKKILEKHIDVIPKFNTSMLEIDFSCIIKFKLVYIITAVLNGLKTKIKGGD